jgi:succinate dehydrogenase / fumarate reductase flavoprotein subunit
MRDEFWRDLKLPSGTAELNQDLERAGRVADFMEFADLLATDALERDESCGAHFREEHQSPEGEAVRDDDRFSYVSAWEFKGVGQKPVLHKEQLVYEAVHLATRSYK